MNSGNQGNDFLELISLDFCKGPEHEFELSHCNRHMCRYLPTRFSIWGTIKNAPLLASGEESQKQPALSTPLPATSVYYTS